MSVHEALQSALENLQSENIQEAKSLLEEILAADPDNSFALHFMGLVHYQMKNYNLAIQYISQAIRLNPHYAEAYNNLGLALQEEGKTNEAMMCYQKALDLKPDFKLAFLNLRNLLTDSGYFDKNKPGSETIRSVISSANRARDLLRELIKGKEYSAISLGQNCNTAWYLKQVGVKTESYPFDWIFSSADISESCLRDNFSIFLNKTHMTLKEDCCSAGHAIYHANMFHHRNPLLAQEEYDYYVRCVERFNRKFFSGEDILFVCTIINEPGKCLGWSSGFCNQYPLPTAQSYHTYESLMEYAKGINKNIKYFFVEQYTEGELSLHAEMVKDDVLSVRFVSHGGNDGVKYLSDIDDFIAKLLFSGMVK